MDWPEGDCHASMDAVLIAASGWHHNNRQALSSLLMPRRTEAELKRCSQCDSPCEGLVQGLLKRL